ncbi:MAG: putative endonuclease [Alteromonas naphthalenivorans]|jgi:putative endonuclease
MLPSSKATIGAQGEERIAQHLESYGFTILKRNFTVRSGEIDIIACKNELLVFVEVKTRSNVYFNTSEVITRSKQKKIALAAKTFLARQNLTDKVYRFDVALIDNNSSKITYMPNAFYG